MKTDSETGRVEVAGRGGGAPLQVDDAWERTREGIDVTLPLATLQPLADPSLAWTLSGFQTCCEDPVTRRKPIDQVEGVVAAEP